MTTSKAELCPTCYDPFTQLSNHWRQTICPFPRLSNYQEEVVAGLLMGDAYLNREYNPRLIVEMTSRDFLEWVDDVLGIHSTGVSFSKSAEDLAKKNERYGYTVNEENYSDMYILRTHNNPNLDPFNWYESGQKRFPPDLDLTPTILKVWYVCDGGMNSHSAGRPFATIGVSNESDRPDYLKSLFKDTPMSPSVHGISIQFTADDTEEMLRWIGEPLPGFEYKWAIP